MNRSSKASKVEPSKSDWETALEPLAWAPRVPLSPETRGRLAEAWACTLSDRHIDLIERVCHVVVFKRQIRRWVPGFGKVTAASERMEKTALAAEGLLELLAADADEPILNIWSKADDIQSSFEEGQSQVLKSLLLKELLKERVTVARRPWPNWILEASGWEAGKADRPGGDADGWAHLIRSIGMPSKIAPATCARSRRGATRPTSSGARRRVTGRTSGRGNATGRRCGSRRTLSSA